MNGSLTVKTDLRNSMLWNAVILGSVLLVCELICLILPIQRSYGVFISIMLAICFIFAYIMTVSNEQGVIRCIPADEMRGARISIELKHNRYEVYSIQAKDVRIKQTGGEKKRNVCRVDFPNERIHLRGICDADMFRQWIETNFV